MRKPLDAPEVSKKLALPAISRENCFCYVSLPESKFDNDMAMLRSLFPMFQLFEEILVENEPRPASSDECHPRFVDKGMIDLYFPDIWEIGCYQNWIWGIFVKMLNQRLEEVSLEEGDSVINLLIALPPW